MCVFDSGTKREEPSLNSEREFASKDGIRRFAVMTAGSGPGADFPWENTVKTSEPDIRLLEESPADPGWPRKKQEERRAHTLLASCLSSSSEWLRHVGKKCTVNKQPATLTTC